MKRRWIVCLAAAGLAGSAAAQESVRYDWTFIEVVAGTNTPVTAPDGVVEPGEGARLMLSVTVLPGIGSPVTYTPPPGPGTGTIAGLSSVFFDLRGSGGSQGVWSSISPILVPGQPPQRGGFPTPDGTAVESCQAGQFIVPGMTANAANPWPDLWRAVWTPASYTPRAATFQSQAAVASGGNHSSIFVQFGLDPDGNPEYAGRYVAGQFGSVEIQIVPAPGILPAVAAGLGLISKRPRRTARVYPLACPLPTSSPRFSASARSASRR